LILWKESRLEGSGFVDTWVVSLRARKARITSFRVEAQAKSMMERLAPHAHQELSQLKAMAAKLRKASRGKLFRAGWICCAVISANPP
jgi:hypothetical protein